jgi:hypothetical protein
MATPSALLLMMLLVYSSQLLTSVECASHDANAFAISELHGLLNTTTLSHAGTRLGNTANCTPGNVIVWGFSFMYSQYESNSCFRTQNRACDIGTTSCSAPKCEHAGAQGEQEDVVGRIALLCGPTPIPGSYTKSVASTRGATVSCNGADTIVHGFKYAHSTSTCPSIADINAACDVGTNSCTAGDLDVGCEGPLITIMLLCAPSKYGAALAQFGVTVDKSMHETATSRSLGCGSQSQDFVSPDTKINYGPRRTFMLGTSIVFANEFEGSVSERSDRNQQAQIRSRACYYNGPCSYADGGIGVNQSAIVVAMCIPDAFIATSLPPSSMPTSQPIAAGTSVPTKQLTGAPSSTPASGPSPTQQPTFWPTAAATLPTLFPTTTGVEGTSPDTTIVAIAAAGGVLLIGIVAVSSRRRLGAAVAKPHDPDLPSTKGQKRMKIPNSTSLNPAYTSHQSLVSIYSTLSPYPSVRNLSLFTPYHQSMASTTSSIGTPLHNSHLSILSVQQGTI